MSVLRRTPRNCVLSFRTVASVVNHKPTSKAPQSKVWRRWRVSLSKRSTSTAWERCVLRISTVPCRAAVAYSAARRNGAALLPDAHRSRARARALSSNIAVRQRMRRFACGCLRIAMPVINVDECRRFVLYLRFYTRLQLHVKAPACWLVSYRTLACC